MGKINSSMSQTYAVIAENADLLIFLLSTHISTVRAYHVPHITSGIKDKRVCLTVPSIEEKNY